MKRQQSQSYLPEVIVILALTVLGIFLFPDPVEAKKEKPRPVKNTILVDCRDGWCYDPQTGEKIGPDKEAPEFRQIVYYFTMPVGY